MVRNENSYSITATEANLKSLVLVIPMAAMGIGVYWMVWGWEKIVQDLAIIPENFFVSLLIFVFGIALHELLHGITWMLVGGLDRSAIKYGFNFLALAPYAHCKEPLAAHKYRLGVIAPGLFLGFLPYVVGMILGEAALIWFGFIFSLAAGGDFLMLWIIRDIPAGLKIVDHPDRVGCSLAE